MYEFKIKTGLLLGNPATSQPVIGITDSSNFGNLPNYNDHEVLATVNAIKNFVESNSVDINKGLDTQIPYMNPTGSDFTYSPNFTLTTDVAKTILNTGYSAITGNIISYNKILTLDVSAKTTLHAMVHNDGASNYIKMTPPGDNINHITCHDTGFISLDASKSMSIGNTTVSNAYLSIKNMNHDMSRVATFLTPDTSLVMSICNDGNIIMNSLHSQTSDKILYYDDTTGYVTYGNASSAGYISSAENGLGVQSGVISLGGQLSRNTTIDISNYMLTLGDLSSDTYINLSGSGDYTKISGGDDTGRGEVTLTNGGLNFKNSNDTSILSFDINLGYNVASKFLFSGGAAAYDTDYSPDFNDRSIPDVGWVNSAISSGIVTPVNEIGWAHGSSGSMNYMLTAFGDGSIIAESAVQFNSAAALMSINSNIRLSTNREIQFNNTSTTYMRESTGEFGSVAVYGEKGGFAGYSIKGQCAFMSDGTTMGLYDDINNSWSLTHTIGGTTALRYADSEKFKTGSTGTITTGDSLLTGNIRVGTDKAIQFDNGTTYYMRESTGGYGSVAVYGDKTGYAGYSIEGQYVFMSNGTSIGIYNDIDDEWMINSTRNAETNLYYNGSKKFETTNTGGTLTGSLTVSSDVIVNGGDITINNNNGGIKFNDVSNYWLSQGSGWGIYWNTETNEIEFHGSSAQKAAVDLDNGNILTSGGLFATSASRIGNNLMVDNTSQNASISLAIGDSDTGFNSASDGNMQVYANNTNIANWQSSGFNFTTHTDMTSVLASSYVSANYFIAAAASTSRFGGTSANQARINLNTANSGSPQIELTENSDMSWSIGGDDGDNSFKIHGSASATPPTINNLASPHFEITTSGQILVQNGSVSSPRYSFGNDTDTGFYYTGTAGRVSLACGGTEEFRFDNGTFHAHGDVVAYSTSITSDIRLKKDIVKVENSLQKILKTNGVEFKYNKDNSKHLGYIAQEMEEIIPEIVLETEMLGYDDKYKTIRYQEILPHITEAIKEQQVIIEQQQDQINKLTELIQKLLK